MHQQPTSGPSPAALKQALLGLLVEDHPGHWSVAELQRALTPPGSPHASDVEDALADLYAAGLVHRNGPFAFATRAAHEAQRLDA